MGSQNPILMGCIIGFVSVLALIVSIATEYWLTAEFQTPGQADAWVKERWGLFSMTSEDSTTKTSTRFDIDGPNGWIVWSRVFLVLSIIISMFGVLVGFFASCGAGGKIASHIATLYHIGTGLGTMGIVIFVLHLYVYKLPSRGQAPPAAGGVVREPEEETISELYSVSWSFFVGMVSLVVNVVAGCFSKRGTHDGY
jgi:hypothetical protein